MVVKGELGTVNRHWARGNMTYSHAEAICLARMHNPTFIEYSSRPFF